MEISSIPHYWIDVAVKENYEPEPDTLEMKPLQEDLTTPTTGIYGYLHTSQTLYSHEFIYWLWCGFLYSSERGDPRNRPIPVDRFQKYVADMHQECDEGFEDLFEVIILIMIIQLHTQIQPVPTVGIDIKQQKKICFNIL